MKSYKLGLIGEKLGHSFSRDIHSSLGNYSYDLIEVEKDRLADFIQKKDYSGLNVTIPYKEAVIPYLDKTDDHALAIGAVNTIVNKNGELFGYNTDFFGMERLINHAKIDISDKTVAILGTGGTSKTADAVVKHLGAKKAIKVSRGNRDGAISYDDLYEMAGDIDVIINTTPAGMFPNTEASPIDISRFERLSGVIDAVYNPLRTKLILDAKRRGIKAEGGLYMLVGQAVRASELFTGEVYDEKTTDRVYKRILREKENIVLIGMPASGKSTIGRILEKKLSRRAFDSDKIIEKEEKRSIPDIFHKDGEGKFRDIESSVIKRLSLENGIIIATGGGSILREENIDNLKKNGRLYFIDRPLPQLIPTKSRPLASTPEDIERRFNERYGIYSSAADVRIDANGSAPMAADKIIGDIYS